MTQSRAKINADGEGQVCPHCGSYKVSILEQCKITVERDKRSGKLIFYKDGIRMRRPSCTVISETLLSTVEERSVLSYKFKCRQCGWVSSKIKPRRREEAERRDPND